MSESYHQKVAYNKVANNYEYTQKETFIGKLKKYNYKKVSKNLSSGSIIDLGTGNGDFFKNIKNFERSILAVDISDKLIQIAKKKHNKKIKFLVKNLENFKVKKKFDNIISINVMHRVNTKKFEKLINYCSNNKSKIIIVTMNIFSPQFILIRLIQIIFGIFGYKFGAQVAKKGFSDNQIKKIFKNYKIIKIRNNGYLHNFLPLRCGKYLGKKISNIDDVISNIPLINQLGVSKLVVLQKVKS
jgi:2-polyprenyl-3-methyl-5-hydroxy-6-metoxy-1,4-benzoquinol methylase